MFDDEYRAHLYDKRDVVGVDAPPPTEKFVLKHSFRFFYGTKNDKAMWTYDIKLALAVTQHEAEALIAWLNMPGLTLKPSPVKEPDG